jgi:hypothetical protein
MVIVANRKLVVLLTGVPYVRREAADPDNAATKLQLVVAASLGTRALAYPISTGDPKSQVSMSMAYSFTRK